MIDRKLTWKRQPVDPRDFKFSATERPVDVNRPATFQLHVVQGGTEPAIWDQGNIGSCTAHGNAYALMRARLASGRRTWVPSRLALYYMERELEDSVASDDGAYVRTGLKVAAKIGVAPEHMWGYDPAKVFTKPPQEVYERAAFHKASNYYAVGQNADEIETCIAQGFPVVFGFLVYDSIKTVEKSPKVIPMPKPWQERCQGGHCVALCGYDSVKRVFTIRNSWGVLWSDRGYGYLPYEYVLNSELSSDFWTARVSM